MIASTSVVTVAALRQVHGASGRAAMRLVRHQATAQMTTTDTAGKLSGMTYSLAGAGFEYGLYAVELATLLLDGLLRGVHLGLDYRRLDLDVGKGLLMLVQLGLNGGVALLHGGLGRAGRFLGLGDAAVERRVSQYDAAAQDGKYDGMPYCRR